MGDKLDLESQSKDFMLRLISGLARERYGLSAKYILTTLTGLKFKGGTTYYRPLDAYDFKRCSQLIDDLPELREHLQLMRKESFGWDAIINRWDSLESQLKTDENKFLGSTSVANFFSSIGGLI